MNYLATSFRGRIVIAWVISISGLFVFAAVAFAQSPAPTAIATSSPTPTATATPLTSSMAPPEQRSGFIYVVLLLTMLFALVALGILYWYMFQIQSRYYTAAEQLSRAGKAIKAISTASFAPAGASGSPPTSASPKLTITGSPIVTVAIESEIFKATLDPDDPSASITWSVTPSNAAIAFPTTGREVQVIAAMAGAFTLTGDAGSNRKAEFKIAAVAPQSIPVELPYFGSGHGSITIAILLLATVIMLGLAGILSGEGVATLLGGLSGYIFGVGITSARSQAEVGKPSG